VALWKLEKGEATLIDQKEIDASIRFTSKIIELEDKTNFQEYNPDYAQIKFATFGS